MNITVVLHPVRAPNSFTVNRRAQKIFIHREEFILNPADKNALEAALRLAEQPHPPLPSPDRFAERQERGSVTAVAFGEAPADEVVRLARAMGAARAIRVSDSALARADASAHVAVLKRLVAHVGGADLILLGAEVLDSDLAQTGPRLAQALDWPLISEAHQLSVSGNTLTAVVRRQGAFHNVGAALPAVVGVARDSNKPRYAHGRDLLDTFKAQDAVEVLTLADLQLSEADVAPFVEVRGESFPPERELGRMLDGALDDVALQLVGIIRKS
jgi:electron transfer flavoprotein beta subunit